MNAATVTQCNPPRLAVLVNGLTYPLLPHPTSTSTHDRAVTRPVVLNGDLVATVRLEPYQLVVHDRDITPVSVDDVDRVWLLWRSGRRAKCRRLIGAFSSFVAACTAIKRMGHHQHEFEIEPWIVGQRGDDSRIAGDVVRYRQHAARR